MYISQDPIGLNGGHTLYSYVKDVNGWVDVLGLAKKKGGKKQSAGSQLSKKNKQAFLDNKQAIEDGGVSPRLDNNNNQKQLENRYGVAQKWVGADEWNVLDNQGEETSHRIVTKDGKSGYAIDHDYTKIHEDWGELEDKTKKEEPVESEEKMEEEKDGGCDS